MAKPTAASLACGKKHMGLAMQALCFFYRNPPPESGVSPRPYSEIPKLIKQPHMKISRVKMAVKRFLQEKEMRGRKPGWRKTTVAEDKAILACFHRVRKPLGILVEAPDVWKGLKLALRQKVCIRTVANRLRQMGYKMENKLAGDDKGELWKRKRVKFCQTHMSKTATQWARHVQAVADFRYFTYYPKEMKSRHARKSAPRTIMHKREKHKMVFMKPKRTIFKRSEYKRAQKAKVFGLTTSNGRTLICHVPLHFDSRGWVGLVRRKVGGFSERSFPHAVNVHHFVGWRDTHAHGRGQSCHER